MSGATPVEGLILFKENNKVWRQRYGVLANRSLHHYELGADRTPMLDGDCTTLPLDGTSLLLNVAKFKFIVVTPGHEKKEQLSAFRVESESVMQTWVNVICAVQANCDTRSGELPSPGLPAVRNKFSRRFPFASLRWSKRVSVDTGITSVNVSGQELADHHGRSFKRSMPKSEAAQADNKPALQRSELSAVLSSAIDAVDDVAGIASDAVDAGGEFTGRYPDWQVSCDASTRLLAEISAIDQLTKFIGQRELADAGAGAAVPPRSPHRTNSSKIQTPALSTVTQQLSDPSAVIPRTVINDGCTSNFSRELSGVDDTRKIRDELRAEIARVVFHVDSLFKLDGSAAYDTKATGRALQDVVLACCPLRELLKQHFIHINEASDSDIQSSMPRSDREPGAPRTSSDIRPRSSPLGSIGSLGNSSLKRLSGSRRNSSGSGSTEVIIGEGQVDPIDPEPVSGEDDDCGQNDFGSKEVIRRMHLHGATNFDRLGSSVSTQSDSSRRSALFSDMFAAPSEYETRAALEALTSSRDNSRQNSCSSQKGESESESFIGGLLNLDDELDELDAKAGAPMKPETKVMLRRMTRASALYLMADDDDENESSDDCDDKDGRTNNPGPEGSKSASSTGSLPVMIENDEPVTGDDDDQTFGDGGDNESSIEGGIEASAIVKVDDAPQGCTLKLPSFLSGIVPEAELVLVKNDNGRVRAATMHALFLHVILSHDEDSDCSNKDKDNLDHLEECFVLCHNEFTTSAQIIEYALEVHNRVEAFYPLSSGEDLSRLPPEEVLVIHRRACILAARVLPRDWTGDLHRLLALVRDLVVRGIFDVAAMVRAAVLNAAITERIVPQEPRILSDIQVSIAPTTLEDVAALELARELALMNHNMYCDIELSEVLAWTRKQTSEDSPNIMAMIVRFNEVSGWCTSQILRHDLDAKCRIKAYIKMVDVAKRLKGLRCFDMLMALLSAINSSAVQRLHSTVEGAGSRTRQSLSRLNLLMSHEQSFATYRAALKVSVLPAVPYVGRFLTDATFVKLGNPDTVECPGATGSKLVNFSKYDRLYSVCAGVRRFQRERYPFVSQPSVRTFLGEFEHQTPEEHYQLSQFLEPTVAE